MWYMQLHLQMDFEGRLTAVCDGCRRNKKLQRKGTNAFSDLCFVPWIGGHYEATKTWCSAVLHRKTQYYLWYLAAPQIGHSGNQHHHRTRLLPFLKIGWSTRWWSGLYKYVLKKSSRIIFKTKTTGISFIKEGIVKQANLTDSWFRHRCRKSFIPHSLIVHNGRLNFSVHRSLFCTTKVSSNCSRVLVLLPKRAQAFTFIW